MQFTILSRQELFDLVWATPMQTLARRFGITDVALKKHGIPTPGVGYWARVTAGQKVKRPVLPKPPGPHRDRIVLKPALPAKPPVPKEELPSIVMPTKLVEPHEATIWAEQRLNGSTRLSRMHTVGRRWAADISPTSASNQEP